MNFCQTITILFVIGSYQVTSAQEDFIQSIRSLGALHKADAVFNSAEYMSVSGQALRKWSEVPQEDRTRFSQKMFLVHFRRAEILAAAGDFEAAAGELKAEATLQNEFGGRLEYSTKRSDTFFEGLITLQAQLTAETGSDPLANKVGYSFEKEGDDFTAARLELGDDAAGISVPEMTSEEALALVHRVSRQGGRFVASAPKWFVVPKGRLPDVLKLAKREVTFDSTGKMTVHALQAGSGTAPTATNSDNATAAPQVPPMVQPATPKKATEAKPASTPSEEPASSTPWSVIALLIVAAIGLLWLLVKKRK